MSDEKNNFIITLPSDVFSENNRNNTMSNYKTDFIDPFNLNGSYECGLVEIIYPTSVKNIPFNVKIHLKYKYNMEAFNIVSGTIPSAQYKTEDELIIVIKNKMESVTNDFILNKVIKKFGKFTNIIINSRPEFELKNNIVECINGEIDIKNSSRNLNEKLTLYWDFDDYLHQMLGFSDTQENDDKFRGKYPIDLYGQCHALYVYTNIIQESFVGRAKSQLLRIIPLDNPSLNRVGSMKSVAFNPILFFPLRIHNFDSIEIQIRDSTGRHVIFDSGKTIVTLMFRNK
jgi:hypothetical protein